MSRQVVELRVFSSVMASDGGTLLEQVPEGLARLAAEEQDERALGQIAAIGHQPLVVLLGEQRAAEAQERPA